MPLNSNTPNSSQDINRFSKGVENFLDSVGHTSIQDVLNTGRSAFGKEKINSRSVLNEIVASVDTPLLKNLAKDTLTVLSNWFEDPQTVCCLVQGLVGLHSATTNTLSDDTNFMAWLDILIAFVDVIIVMLTSNIKKLAFFIPDLIKEIMNGVIGAILLVLQELLFAIRDSLINELLRAIDSDELEDHIWAKCLPLAELIAVLKKYINDFGLLSQLFELLKGYVGKLVGDFGYMKALDFPNNIKDLEFLYWFRDLLLKLKQAVLSFELCYLPQFNATGGIVPTPVLGGMVRLAEGNSPQTEGKGSPAAVQGVVIAADGTILQDTNSLKKNSVPILTNSSIRGFLNKYYGYPLDVIDRLLVGSTSKDNIQGSNINSENPNRVSDLNADCPNSPNPADIVKWALRVRNRNI